jgi:hypothetical protein
LILDEQQLDILSCCSPQQADHAEAQAQDQVAAVTNVLLSLSVSETHWKKHDESRGQVEINLGQSGLCPEPMQVENTSVAKPVWGLLCREKTAHALNSGPVTF